MSYSISHTSNYYIINENEKEIKCSATVDSLACLPFYYRKVFSRKLPRKYIAKLLHDWRNKKYDREYWKQMEEN